MNILLLGTPRTKSSVYAETLSRKYDAHYYHEPFAMALTHYRQSDSLSKQDYAINILNVFNNKVLPKKKNNVVKIFAGNLGGLYQYVEYLNFSNYQSIYLIERHDFFEQACSIQIAKNQNFTNSNIQKTSEEKKYILERHTVQHLKFEVMNYLSIKRYLQDNKIPFITETYERLPKKIPSFQKPLQIDYSNTILNYHHKTNINDIFNKAFDYQSCLYDENSFDEKLKNIAIL